MKCPFCELPGQNLRRAECSPRLAAAMNERRRLLTCPSGHTWRTTEVDAAELADLRRRAHLYEMAIGSAAREPT